MRLTFSLLLLALTTTAARADNLLRNGDFQDDWSTLLPELKNHHWNYTTEVYNRRDYNPDGWSLGGKWVWKDADKPHGQRKLFLAPGSRAVQSVNWVTINNSAKLAGWPDAGGFPGSEAVRTKQPLALVRDLEFRVKLSGANVGKDGVKLVVAWSAASPIDDPLGTKRVASATISAPEGTYAAKEVSVKLPAATWLAEAQKDPLFAAQGALVPMAATVEVSFAEKSAGTVELIDAALVAPASAAPNVLANPSFETLDKFKWPADWSKPQKYRYFPPGDYYIFNTWHNSTSENRGKVFLDEMVRYQHRNALAMRLASGDEAFVASAPIALNQTEARLVEVTAMVRTDQLAMFQIDAEDETGKRIDGFNFIHKAMPSVGTNDWRLVRQVFRPAAPLKSVRIKLCARGTNGNTQDGTGPQPQQNADGFVWWDAVTVYEPESTAAELAARKVKVVASEVVEPRVYLDKLQFGERLLGKTYLTAEVVNPTKDVARVKLGVHTIPGSSSVVTYSEPLVLAPNARAAVRVEHGDLEPTRPYYGSRLGVIISGTEMGGGYRENTYSGPRWTVPMDLRLGALYLRPDQKQFVRLNLGLTADVLARARRVDYEIVRVGAPYDKPLKTVSVPLAADSFEKQRERIPDGLRGDFRNLLLADLDVSALPVQPFTDPSRNWRVRVSLFDARGNRLSDQYSPPFCRLAHDAPQPAITSVKISGDGDFLVNDKPWMPWGVTYGHNPVFAGPADGAKVLDLANLKMWSLYDRHGGNLSDRAQWDINCLRHVEGPVIKQPQLEEMWKKNLYASTVFLKPRTAKEPWPDDLLKYLKTAPNVAAVSRGPEEAFGHFFPMTPAQLADLKAEVDALRAATGKPVMVGHGGYWTRLEFEKVPFFDIFDPETEPWYPAPLHTDLAPLVAGKGKVMWLRPQMYESVPYERWRYHVFVELMRGARGWQIAHGPGDASLMRGLHAELRAVQPFVYSKEKPPEVKIGPGFEHMARRLGNKTLIVAATSHGIPFGNWRPFAASGVNTGMAVETAPSFAYGDESDGYKRADDPAAPKFVAHGVQFLPNPQKWPAGSKLVTRVYLDLLEPKGLAVLVKCDGRWTHAAQWGAADYGALRTDPATALWFLHTFYRHSRGFLGWGDKVPQEALELIPKTFEKGGLMPATRGWTPIEIPLEKIGAADKLLDGVGFLHPGTGAVQWTGTKIVGPKGDTLAVFNDVLDMPDPTARRQTKVFVAGLKKGTKVRVLFEDRELVADDGFFVDDFLGTDLYQRYGGERSGYGSAPVALHVYEVP